MSVQIKDFLKARRDRALGTILGYVEKSDWGREMPEPEWQGLRGIVIEALNGYHDSVLDLVKSENGTVRNDLSVDLLNRLDQYLADQRY